MNNDTLNVRQFQRIAVKLRLTIADGFCRDTSLFCCTNIMLFSAACPTAASVLHSLKYSNIVHYSSVIIINRPSDQVCFNICSGGGLYSVGRRERDKISNTYPNVHGIVSGNI